MPYKLNEKHPLVLAAQALNESLLITMRVFTPALERLLEAYGIRFERESPNNDEVVKSKLAAAGEALTEASRHISELENRMEAKRLALAETARQYAHFQQLAETEKVKADALLAQVSTTIASGQIRERTWGFFLSLIGNLIVFVLGVILAPKVQATWNWVWHR